MSMLILKTPKRKLIFIKSSNKPGEANLFNFAYKTATVWKEVMILTSNRAQSPAFIFLHMLSRTLLSSYFISQLFIEKKIKN